jgi:hypothetical protein
MSSANNKCYYGSRYVCKLEWVNFSRFAFNCLFLTLKHIEGNSVENNGDQRLKRKGYILCPSNVSKAYQPRTNKKASL